MKKTETTLLLRSRKKVWSLKIQQYAPELHWVNGTELLQASPDGFLLEVAHPHQQTQLHLTGAAACQVLSFDQKGAFVSLKPCERSSTGAFSLLIPEPIILVLPVAIPLHGEELEGLSGHQ